MRLLAVMENRGGSADGSTRDGRSSGTLDPNVGLVYDLWGQAKLMELANSIHRRTLFAVIRRR